MILLRGTRFSQPIGAAEIDYGNTLSLGLIQAVSGGETRYSCGNFSIASSKKTTTTYGPAESTVLNQLLPATQNISGTNSSFTLLSIELVSSSVASTACIYKLGNASNAARAWVSSANGTTAGAISAYIYLGGNRTLGGSFVKPVGSMYIGVLRHRHGVGASLFVDGAEDPVNALFTNTSLGHGFFGVRQSPTGGANALSVVWNRALSDAEIAEISSNPWQLFRPVQRRVYFDIGAGGGGEPATHDTSGAITSSPAELSGAAERTRQHDTSAELAGADSVVSATARRNVTLGSSGALSVGLAVVTASASHTAGHAEHSTSGTVAAPGASLSGSASRVPAPATHDTSGDLGGMGAVIDGQAQGPQTGSMRPGFEMSSRKVYIKRGKRIHIFDSVEDADAWMEAEQQALQAIRKAKPTPRKKAKVFKGLDEAVPHEVVSIDVVRAMVDYLGIPVEMPTLEARQDWAEVARVALMARQMQDEEDIELLLAA